MTLLKLCFNIFEVYSNTMMHGAVKCKHAESSHHGCTRHERERERLVLLRGVDSLLIHY